MTTKAKLYDYACFTLAKHFVDAEIGPITNISQVDYRQKCCDELATQLQSVAEDWVVEHMVVEKTT